MTYTQVLTNENGGYIRMNVATGGLTFSNASFLQNGDLEVQAGQVNITQSKTHGGNFLISSGATLNFSNTSANTKLNGNVTNNGTILVGGSRSIEFTGSSGQTLAGNGASITSLTIANANGLDITGSQVITTLNMTNGKAFLHDGDLSVTNLSNTNENRYIITAGTGRLIQDVTVSGKVFPVGPDNSSYNPVTLQQTSGTANFGIRAQQGFDYPTNGSDYIGIQWTIDFLSGTASTDVTLQWNDNNSQGSFDPGNCHISRWDGAEWRSFGDGAASCQGSTCSRTVTGVTEFSPFGVASGITLPVDLLSFNVQVQNKSSALLTWQTASEQNNMGWGIERSRDAQNWSALTWQPSDAVHGHSKVILNYTYTDGQPLQGINYYRLKQTDYNGSYKYSEIRSVIFDKAHMVRLFPNPATERMTLDIQDPENYQIDMLNYSGKVIYGCTLDGNLFDLRSLLPGTYHIRLTGKKTGEVICIPFIKI